MEIKKVEQDDDKPFCQITLTKAEARILKELCHYNLDGISHSNYNYCFPENANSIFARPMYNKLDDLGV